MQSEGNLSVSIVRQVGKPVFAMARWLRFLGILMIVISVLSVLGMIAGFAATIVGSLRIGRSELYFIAIPVLISIFSLIVYMWLGTLLFKSGKMAEPAYLQGDSELLTKSLENLKTYFIVVGILTLISLVGMIIAMCVVSLMSIFSVSTFQSW
jgi:hypothetical protein